MVMGTAQWGSDYGITNEQGRLSDQEVRAQLELLHEHEMRFLDTAPAYGDAEQRIGRQASGMLVQSKISALSQTPDNLLASLTASRTAIRDNRLHGLLVHDWHLLDIQDRAVAAGVLSAVRAQGLVDRIGVSAYTAADVASALAHFGQLDVVQVPVNVLDQRLTTDAAIAELRARGGVVQARSVYLQGLLVSASQNVMFAGHPDLAHWRDLVQTLAVDPSTLALAFIRQQPWVDEVVVGAASVAELAQTIVAWQVRLPQVDWAAFASADLTLIDPRQWPPRSMAAG